MYTIPNLHPPNLATSLLSSPIGKVCPWAEAPIGTRLLVIRVTPGLRNMLFRNKDEHLRNTQCTTSDPRFHIFPERTNHDEHNIEISHLKPPSLVYW